MKGSSQQKEMQVSGSKKKKKKRMAGDFPDGPVAKTPRGHHSGDLGLTPGQGTNFHMPATKDPTRHNEDPVQPSN